MGYGNDSSQTGPYGVTTPNVKNRTECAGRAASYPIGMPPLNWTLPNRTSAHRLLRLVLLLAIFSAADLHQDANAQVAIPETPAGRTLAAWLRVFNSGDKNAIETYIRTVDPSQSVENMLSFHNQTNGFELLSIVSSDQRNIRFVVKENAVP